MGKPKIRFKGYEDDWEQRKLSEITIETYGGGTPKTANEEFWKGDIPWIQSSDLVEECLFDVKPRKSISQEAVSKSATKLVPQNSIAIVTRVGVGKLAFMPFSYATSQDFLSISELKTAPEFTVYALYRMMQLVSNEVQGTSIKGITKNELLAKKMLIPSRNEQKKIGTYLHIIDRLITLHQRKCEETKSLKKYMLQKMFPENGKCVPKIRFSGFSDAWEQRKFGDLYCKVSEKNDLSFGSDKIISVANMYFKEDVKDSSEEYMRTYNVMRLGDIAFEGNKSKNYAHGRFVENTIGDGIVSHVFDVFRPIAEYDLYFWKYLINNEDVMGRIMTRCTKASTMMTNLVTNDFLKEEIMVPSLDEQRKIGKYLDDLDNLITLHQHKCDELQKLKKFMLQNMFVQQFYNDF